LPLRFKPTVMQLLQPLFTSRQSPSLRFQSHNGAIAASCTISPVPMKLCFQSHNGAIAANCDLADNPATVAFQSHNGAIAAFEV